MCRLYAGEGKRQKGRAFIDTRITLDMDDLKLISEIARMKRERQRKRGDTADYSEADEIRWAVIKHLDELRRAGKGALDAESRKYWNDYIVFQRCSRRCTQ